MIISKEDVQKILDYLGTCPAGQVYDLITIMLNLKEDKKKETNQELNDLS